MGTYFGTNNFVHLGSTAITVAVGDTESIPIPSNFQILTVFYRITGYQANGIAGLQFNNDTGLNYWTRWNIAGGGTTFTTSQTAGTIQVSLGGAAVQNGRSGWATIFNIEGVPKIVKVNGQTATTNAATAGAPETGSGQWTTTNNELISSITMHSSGGALNVGTGFAIFGSNILV